MLLNWCVGNITRSRALKAPWVCWIGAAFVPRTSKNVECFVSAEGENVEATENLEKIIRSSGFWKADLLDHQMGSCTLPCAHHHWSCTSVRVDGKSSRNTKASLHKVSKFPSCTMNELTSRFVNRGIYHHPVCTGNPLETRNISIFPHLFGYRHLWWTFYQNKVLLRTPSCSYLSQSPFQISTEVVGVWDQTLTSKKMSFACLLILEPTGYQTPTVHMYSVQRHFK